MTERELML